MFLFQIMRFMDANYAAEVLCSGLLIKLQPVWYLGQCSGSTVAETNRHVLKRLLSNVVDLQCNWKGKRGKYGLHSSIMKQIICGTLKVVCSKLITTTAECEYIIQHLLHRDWPIPIWLQFLGFIQRRIPYLI